MNNEDNAVSCYFSFLDKFFRGYIRMRTRTNSENSRHFYELYKVLGEQLEKKRHSQNCLEQPLKIYEKIPQIWSNLCFFDHCCDVPQ